MKLSERSGFTLVEVTLALGIASFCLIALFALLPLGMQTTADSTMETEASSFVSSIIADLKSTPESRTTSQRFGIPFPNSSASTNPNNYPTLFLDKYGARADSPSATYTSHTVAGENIPNASYRVAVTMKKNMDTKLIHTRVTISWPALSATTSSKLTAVTSFFRD